MNLTVQAFYAFIGVVVLVGMFFLVMMADRIYTRIKENHRENLILKRRILRNMRYHRERTQEYIDTSFRDNASAVSSGNNRVIAAITHNMNRAGQKSKLSPEIVATIPKPKLDNSDGVFSGIKSTKPKSEKLNGKIVSRDASGRFTRVGHEHSEESKLKQSEVMQVVSQKYVRDSHGRFISPKKAKINHAISTMKQTFGQEQTV